MVSKNQSMNLRLKWLAIFMLCFGFPTTQGGLTLFIHSDFAVKQMGYDVKGDIFLINNGVTNKEFRNRKLFLESIRPLNATMNRVELTWMATNHDERYSLRITSANLNILQNPTLSLSRLQGNVSRIPKTFTVNLHCTSSKQGLVYIHFALNYTHFLKKEKTQINRTLQFTIPKLCDRTGSGSGGPTKPVDRKIVVTLSACFAFLLCLVIATVFFFRYAKRIKKKFGFDEAREQLSPRRPSITSSNISIPQTSQVPTVVYSPKRQTSGQFFTKLAKYDNTTTRIQGHSCDTTADNGNNSPASPISFNGQSLSNNGKLFTHISVADDDVFVADETDVALIQNQQRQNEKLSLAKESSDKQLAFTTLNEYWSEKLEDSVKSRDQVEIRSEVLGEGTFGRVLRGKLIVSCEQTESNVDVAVKICHDDVEFENIISFVNEAILMKNLCHDNLLDLLGVVLQPCSAPLVLTPNMQHGNLHKFLRHSRGIGMRRQLIGSQQLVNFGSQIARGMEYLASRKIIHRDLAAKNCFVDRNLNVKIGDFGLAREVKQFDLYKMEHPSQLAVKWLALESLLYYMFSEKSDVWSFGIVLWELVTLGSQPYAGLDNYEVMPYLETSKRLPRPLRCPDDLYSIMRSCWLPTPEERPSFSILVHKLEDYELRLRPSCITFEFDEDTIEMSDGLV